MKDIMATTWKQSGFSIIELMVALAIFAIMAGVSAPHLQNAIRNYRLKSAVMDLHSNMQVAKLSAVKYNLPAMIRFNAANSYSIIQCLVNGCNPGVVPISSIPKCSPPPPLGTSFCVINTESFATKYGYGDEIEFGRPDVLPPYTFPMTALVFGSVGTTPAPGYGYLWSKSNSVYYRVGTRFIAGTLEVERWNGSTWN